MIHKQVDMTLVKQARIDQLSDSLQTEIMCLPGAQRAYHGNN